MTADNFDFTGFYTIILLSHDNDQHQQYGIVGQILNDCWKSSIINVALLVATTANNAAAIYTYFPFTRFQCEQITPVMINSFASGSFLYPNASIFPDKSKNMHKCPVIVGVYDSTPLPNMLLKTDPNGTLLDLDGFEGITLLVLAQQLNFTPVLIESSRLERTGHIYPNGTMTGVMGLLQTNSINMTLGALLLNPPI